MDLNYHLRLSFTYAIDAKKLGNGPFRSLIINENEGFEVFEEEF